MPQPAANPEPSPAALADDERRERERQEAIDAYNTRRAELGKPPLEPDKVARWLAVDEEVRQQAAAMRRHDEQKRAHAEAKEQQARRSFSERMAARIDGIRKAAPEREASNEPAPAGTKASSAATPSRAKKDKILCFPIIPATARAVVNEIASSALFAAIQGKDRTILNDAPIAATGDTTMFFSGEQLNQDDHDVFMQLVYLASAEPLGAYVTVSAHCLLKALGRKTGGTAHQQLDAEIERLTKATVKIKGGRGSYIGHLIHDAVKHEISARWVYRLNENLLSLYGASCYTLIDWEQRKRLKGKDLARWLQLEIARHALPFPIKVETLRGLCGSTAKELYHFRATLKKALNELQTEGHIAAWQINENDLVHVDRGAALTASQRRSLAPPPKR